jgi:hypothetical protein
MLGVVMLTVAIKLISECRYAECRYAECRGVPIGAPKTRAKTNKIARWLK